MVTPDMDVLRELAREGVKDDAAGIIKSLEASEVMCEAIESEMANHANAPDTGKEAAVVSSRIAEAASQARAAMFNLRNTANAYGGMDTGV